MSRISVLRTLMSILLTVALTAFATAQAKPSEELDMARCWAVTAEAPVSQLATEGGRSYAGFDGGRLGSFSLDGKPVWSAEFGGEIASNILVGESLIYLATNASGVEKTSVLRFVSRDTGIVAGTIPLPGAERHYISSLKGLLVIVSANGVVQLLDDKGGVKWRREIAAGFAGTPAIGTDRLYVGSIAQQVFTLNLANGEIESVRKMPFNVTALAVTPDGSLIVGDERGNLTSLSSDGHSNWRFRSGGRISRISSSNGDILALSHDNFVYCIDANNGSVRWKRRLAGRAAHSATLDDAYTVTTSLDEHGAVLTYLESGRPAGQIVLGHDEFVSADPSSAGSLVLIGTNTSLYGYSLAGQSGCPK